MLHLILLLCKLTSPLLATHHFSWLINGQQVIQCACLAGQSVYIPLLFLTYWKHNIHLFHMVLQAWKHPKLCLPPIRINITLALTRREHSPVSALKSWFFTLRAELGSQIPCKQSENDEWWLWVSMRFGTFNAEGKQIQNVWASCKSGQDRLTLQSPN